MKKTLPKIVFFGTEKYSQITLQKLLDKNYPIAAVITKPDAKSGRGRKITIPPVKVLAEKYNIPVWQPEKLTAIESEIKSLGPVVGVLVAYGKIIPKSIIDLFVPGIINLHPSLLPRWRGPSPIESTIYNMDKEAGLSIMKLDAEMDAGPIYAQTKIPLSGDENKLDLYTNLFTKGSEELVAILGRIVNGEITATQQNDAEATYSKLLSKEMSDINHKKLTSAQANAHVRAYLDFPKSTFFHAGKKIIVTKSHVSASAETDIDLRCSDNNWLVIDELIAPSGKKMTTQSYLNGQHK